MHRICIYIYIYISYSAICNILSLRMVIYTYISYECILYDILCMCVSYICIADTILTWYIYCICYAYKYASIRTVHIGIFLKSSHTYCISTYIYICSLICMYSYIYILIYPYTYRLDSMILWPSIVVGGLSNAENKQLGSNGYGWILGSGGPRKPPRGNGCGSLYPPQVQWVCRGFWRSTSAVVSRKRTDAIPKFWQTIPRLSQRVPQPGGKA